MIFTDVLIDDYHSNRIYTNDDTISGTVRVTILGSQEVFQLLLMVEGVAIATAPLNDGGSKGANVTNSHIFSRTSEVLFPNKEQSAVLESKSYTFAQGLYEYPFSIKIPGISSCMPAKDCPVTFSKVQDHGTLRFKGAITGENWVDKVSGSSCAHGTGAFPPTFDLKDRAKIEYIVHGAFTIPSAILQPSAGVKRTIKFVPCDILPPPSIPLSTYDMVQKFNWPTKSPIKTQGFFRYQLQSPYLVCGNVIPAVLSFGLEERIPSNILLPIYLDHVRVRLVSLTNIRAVKLGWKKNTMHKKSISDVKVLWDEPARKYPLDISGLSENNQIEIPSELYSCSFPTTLPPTFDTCTVSRSYVLETTVSYSFSDTEKTGQEVEKVCFLSKEVLVRSGTTLPPPDFDAPEEVLPIYSKILASNDG